MAKLTKPYLGMKFAHVRWSVIGDLALANFGSSQPPETIDMLVDVKDKQKLEEYFTGKEIERNSGGERQGFVYTKWSDFMVYYYHLPNFPEIEKHPCTTTKGWPLCNCATVIAWTLLDCTKQNLANIMDVMIGGIEIDWDQVRHWASVFESSFDYDSLEKIGSSITQDDIWDRLEV